MVLFYLTFHFNFSRTRFHLKIVCKTKTIRTLTVNYHLEAYDMPFLKLHECSKYFLQQPGGGFVIN